MPMPEHKILVSQPVDEAGHEFAQMSAASSGDRNGKSAGPVSVFRRKPGMHVQPVPPVMLELKKSREIFATPIDLPRSNPARVWDSLSELRPDTEILAGNGLFPETSDDPAVAAFDLLRTRLLQGLTEQGWSRIAVTSPNHGCGKSFVALNLAFSLARRAEGRTVLMDLDLRKPALAGLLGAEGVPPLAEFLSGEQPLEAQFRRFGRRLALALNDAPVEGAAEVLGAGDTASALAAMHEHLAPEVVIYDLPPVLTCDDVLAMAGQIDAVLLIADGTRTSAADIRATERLLAGVLPIMGVVLNRAQDRKAGRYGYGRG